MAKIRLDPQPYVYPLPVALVACQDRDGGANILTVSWIGNVCAQPPMISISLRPHRYSTAIIQETGEFTVNIPSYALAYEVDLCGTLSGREVDKMRVSGLTPVPASLVKAPLLEECGVGMECLVRQCLTPGSHLLFLGEVVALHVEERFLSAPEDPEADDSERTLELTRAKPLIYSPHGHDYWILGDIAQVLDPSRGRKP